MSTAPQPSEDVQPFKVLSLDDGGICGLSSLLILEKIMEEIQSIRGLSEIPKPCDIFDLIGGTGTGGISAIMLGRLGMPISDCIQAFKKISNTAFAPTQQAWWTRIKRKSTSSISTTNLENAIKEAIRDNCPLIECAQAREVGRPGANVCEHEDQRFFDEECVKTVALATTKVNINARPILFRTYDATASLSKCKIWEVGRATSATVKLFNPIKLGRDDDEFVNSSFGFSNPCMALITEATKHISEQQKTLILSIGTGLGGVVEISDTKRSIKSALSKMATSSKRVADELEANYPNNNGDYYRFNTEIGLKNITLSEWVEPSKVSAHTKNYLNEKQEAIKKFVKALAFPLVSRQPEMPEGPVSIHYLPFHENRNFVGRQEVLSRLKNMLFAQAGFQQVALAGLGGMGKTQVALKLAYTVKAEHPDYSVFWLTAASIDGFRNSCKELAETLKLKTADGQDPRILVREYLEANGSGKWLLILDNVDDPSLFDTATMENRISSFLPQSEKGRVLFTTRSQTVAWRAAKHDSVDLEEMSTEELTTILSHGVRRLKDESQIRDKVLIADLLKELSHFPLAVAQAADYMATRNISIKKYLELFRETGRSKIELLKHIYVDNVHIDISQSAVATTWLITFEEVQRSSPGAVKLLRFIAHIDSKAIPQSILPVLDEEIKMVEAIAVLVQYGFLREQNTSGIFDMHSLVHFITKFWCKKFKDEEKESLAVISHMASIFPDDEWESRFLWRQYLPHALCVVEMEKNNEMSTSELAFKVGKCLQKDGNTRDAIKVLEDVVKTRDKALETDHPSLLSSQHALAGSYLYDRQVGRAVSMLKHVVMTKEKALAVDDPSRLESQQELGGAYLHDGQVEKAVSMLEHVVKVREEALAADHPDRLESEHVLACAYLDNGQVERAISVLEHVVRTKEEALTADHPDRLASQHELARAYLVNGQVERAVSMLEHVVRTREKALAADHPDLLVSQHVLARAYLVNGQVERAVSILEHVVRADEEALAADHPDRLASQYELARAYLDNGQVEKAVSMLEYVVRTREKALAADHPSRLTSQHELTRAYYAHGQIEKAISVLEHVVELDRISLKRPLAHRLLTQELLKTYLACRPDSKDGSV